MDWLPYLPYVLPMLTGGLAGALVNLVWQWKNARDLEQRGRITLLNALKQELGLSLWLIDYDYSRVTIGELRQTGLIPIGTSNAERVLFGIEVPLPLTDEVKGQLLDYLKQTKYLNSLIAEQASLSPITLEGYISNKQASCLGEIRAICTPDDKFRESDPDSTSLRYKVKRLLQDLAVGIVNLR